jgi:hypothetical protein
MSHVHDDASDTDDRTDVTTDALETIEDRSRTRANTRARRDRDLDVDPYVDFELDGAIPNRSFRSWIELYRYVDDPLNFPGYMCIERSKFCSVNSYKLRDGT